MKIRTFLFDFVPLVVRDSRRDLSQLAIFLKFSLFFRGWFADERRRRWYRIGSSGRVAHGEPPVDSTFGRDAEAKGNKLHSGVQRLRLLVSPSRGLAGLSLCLLPPLAFASSFFTVHPSSLRDTHPAADRSSFHFHLQPPTRARVRLGNPAVINALQFPDFTVIPPVGTNAQANNAIRAHLH